MERPAPIRSRGLRCESVRPKRRATTSGVGNFRPAKCTEFVALFAYVSLNLGIEKKLAFRGYLCSVRLKVVSIFGRQNPDTVVNNLDAPKLGAFAGGQGRALSLRVRFAGRR